MQENITFAQVVAKRASVNPMEPNSSESSTGGCVNTVMSVWSPLRESYANAVKSQSVKLGGVPVNDFKVVGCFSSVTDSTMQERESVPSSWADDDQCFFDSIRIAQVEEPRPRETRIGGEGEGCSVPMDGGFRKNRGERGWRFIGRGRGNNRNNNNRRQRGRTDNQSHNSGINFRGGSSGEPPVLSGGRFASLR